MATNVSPSLGSYVLNKFPSISQWSDTGPSWPSCSCGPKGDGDVCITLSVLSLFTGFIPLSIVSTMLLWESSQWLGKNIVQSTGQGKHGYLHWQPRYNWNTVENGIKHHAINHCFTVSLWYTYVHTGNKNMIITLYNLVSLPFISKAYTLNQHCII